MPIPKFYLNIIIRILLLSITLVFVSMLAVRLEQEYIFSFAGLVFLAVVQVFLLIRYLNKVNRDLVSFITSIKSKDSSLVFTGKHSSGIFGKLYDSLNQFNELISEIKRNSQIQDLFLQQLVEQVDVGIITYKESGEVDLYNNAAGILLNNRFVPNISVLSGTNPELPKLLQEIEPGKPRMIKIQDKNKEAGAERIKHLFINAGIIQYEEERIRLVTLHNITSELDRKEVDSWHKLIRVLSHEIMNSISPITSLTGTISKYFKDADNKPIEVSRIDPSIVKKTIGGLETIEETSQGLLSFVEKYRSLTLVPEPNPSTFPVIELFEKIRLLMEDSLKLQNIAISIKVVPDHLELRADYGQVEQILINLIRNSMDGLKDTDGQVILLKAFEENSRIIIQVIDNGEGIPMEIMDNIFVPFYTTREHGSGIGLSLSRQLMRLHEGSIYASSIPNEKTTISLKF